jgi:hypothetical protein
MVSVRCNVFPTFVQRRQIDAGNLVLHGRVTTTEENKNQKIIHHKKGIFSHVSGTFRFLFKTMGNQL